jgi:crotonobetainyl-CoA:carnitine CoA-transferase CaiB-like acyl-CoA transferase
MLVLDLTRLLPGPLAGRLLADIGYRVLRLVPPSGDLLELAAPEAYGWLHAGKETEIVDLKTEPGRERLRALVAEAAILLETNRPGVMERLGVGPDALRAINPSLTYVRLANYREAAFHDAPGHDLACLAADGLLDRFGAATQTTQLADGTAAFWVVIAAQEGLRRGGGFFEVYLAETARALAYPALPGLDGSRLCYSVYPAADGRVVLAALEPQLWARFCQAVERPEWLPEAYGPTSAENPLWPQLCALFGGRSILEWEQWAQANAVPLRAVAPARVPQTTLPWAEGG